VAVSNFDIPVELSWKLTTYSLGVARACAGGRVLDVGAGYDIGAVVVLVALKYQLSHRTEFLYNGLGVMVLVAGLPRDTNDDVLLAVYVQLSVGYVEVIQPRGYHVFGFLHVFGGLVRARRRSKGNIDAAVYVYAEADVP
jgi:hypothetical protein